MTTRGYHPDRTEPPQVARYTEDQVRRWLGWLAQEMRSRNETELWLHEWSGPRGFCTKVRVGIGAVLGLVLGMVLGLGKSLTGEVALGLGVAPLSMLVLGLFGKRIVKPEPAYRVPFDRRRLATSLLRGVGGGLGVGLALGGFGHPATIANRTLFIFALVVGVVFALTEWLLKPRLIARGPFKRRTMLMKRLLVGLVIGLFVVLVGQLGSELVRALGGGLLFGLFLGWPGGSKPLFRGSSNQRPLAMNLVGRFFLGLFAALAFAFVLAVVSTPLSLNSLIVGVVVGLVVELLFGPASALISFGPDRERLPPSSPTKSIADSARIGVVFGSVFASVFASVFVWPFWAASRGTFDPWLAGAIGLSSIIVGLGFGLAFGLDCVVFYFAFRLWLRAHDKGPLDWPRFLQWACDRLLLRSTGGSFEWVHLELRDYLASQESEEISNPSGERVGPALETLPG